MDKILTILDYHDGPRKGIAEFRGKPHYYECVFDKRTDEYTDTYMLSRITEELLEKALESWGIWKRWKRAFDEGQVSIDSHPALPEDRERRDVLERELKHSLKIDHDKAFAAKAIFRKSHISDNEYLEFDKVEWEVGKHGKK